jgi:hypothetical protein
MKMNVFTLKRVFAVIMLATILTACLKRQDYPPTPAIEYTDFKMYGQDSAELVLHFTDGDGDIGLDEDDTTGSFAPDQPYYYNFVATYFYKDTSGLFVPFDEKPSSPDTLDTLRYRYRIPNITPEGQNKVLDGDMIIKFRYPYYGPGHTAFKYEIYIYDRSLQKSNVIVSPEINP